VIKKVIKSFIQPAPDQHMVKVGRKKIPVVPVSYREKIRLGRSEINFFLNIFFMVLAVFCWTTSILTRDAYFLWTNLGNLVQ
jgi:hypothetical protein